VWRGALVRAKAAYVSAHQLLAFGDRSARARGWQQSRPPWDVTLIGISTQIRHARGLSVVLLVSEQYLSSFRSPELRQLILKSFPLSFAAATAAQV